ncbi:MAG: hypothetical protein NC081_09420 [Roseburia sp.]|nr:hypothetical protein [Roseburia sp.]
MDKQLALSMTHAIFPQCGWVGMGLFFEGKRAIRRTWSCLTEFMKRPGQTGRNLSEYEGVITVITAIRWSLLLMNILNQINANDIILSDKWEKTMDKKQMIDFSTITACGECCIACAKKQAGICGEFPCKQLTSIIHWKPNIEEHMNMLAKKYFEWG